MIQITGKCHRAELIQKSALYSDKHPQIQALKRQIASGSYDPRNPLVTYWMKLFLSWRLSLALFLPKGVVFLVSLPLVLFDPARWYPLLIVPVLETLSYLVFIRSLPASVRKERTIRKTMYIAAVAAPWAMLICGINALFAAFQKSIVWGGVRYSHRSSGGCVHAEIPEDI